MLGNLKHPQLVQLLGYCAREEHRLLVYELVPNRSLEAHLFGAKEGLEGAPPPLPWLPRLRVLLDAAKGLAYLHEELSIQVRPMSAHTPPPHPPSPCSIPPGSSSWGSTRSSPLGSTYSSPLGSTYISPLGSHT